MHPLHFLLAAPFTVAFLLALFPHRFRSMLFPFAFISSLGIAMATVSLLFVPGLLVTESLPWFTLPGSGAVVQFQLFSDPFASWLMALAGVLQVSALWVSHRISQDRFRSYSISFFLLQGALFGSFLSTDLVIFFLFFEALIPPTMMLIANFGGENRSKASILFGAYTLLGSLPMAVAIWFLASKVGSTDSVILQNWQNYIDPSTAKWVFWSFVLAFAVKTPLFPFHSWQAESYSQAPAGLTSILSGVMAKVGVFGFLRWTVPLFPDFSAESATIIAVLGLITLLYGALMAWRQNDIKKVLVYSSLSHLGLAVMGVFTFHQSAIAGVVAMLVAHGLSAGSLFLLLGLAEKSFGTRSCNQFGGIASKSPGYSVLLLAGILASVAIPGTLGFIGEFFILQGIWMRMGMEIALLAGLGAILSAAYSLRLVKSMLFGQPTSTSQKLDLHWGDSLAIAPLIILLFLLGIAPHSVLRVVDNPAPAQEALASATMETQTHER